MWRFFDPMILGMLAVWERLGRIRAVPAVAAFLVVTLALVWASWEPGEPWLWAAMLALLVAYCFARPGGGTNIFGIATLPGCATYFAHELLGGPRWPGVALVPVALWLAWSEDRAVVEIGDEPPSVVATARTT